MEIFQLIIIAFVLFAVSRVFIQFKMRRISIGQFAFWGLLWLFLLAFSITPTAFSLISQTLGIGRIVDVVIYGSIGLLYYMIYRMYVQLEETRSQITQLTRMIALEQKKRKK